MKREKIKTKTTYYPGWLRIILPVLLIVTWLAVAGAGGPLFARISEVSNLDLAAFLPDSAESTKVQEKLPSFIDVDSVSGLVVYESKSGTLSNKTVDEITKTTANLGNIAGVLKDEVQKPFVSDDKKAALISLPIDTSAEVSDVVEEVRTTLSDDPVDSTEHYVTGQAGFSTDLNEAFSGIDGILLFVALGVVFVILVIVYRSPVLPIIVLMTSLLALAASILLVFTLAKSGIVTINGQVQGILFILVIGAATDYSLLYVSRYREELYYQQSKVTATIKALKASVEPILASGGTVIAGLLCLLLSDLASNQALGPVGSIGVLLAMASALTFLPSVLALVGRKAFWPLVPQANKVAQEKHRRQAESGIWHKVGDFVAKRPRPIWITTVAILAIASLGTFGLRAEGTPQSELISGYSEAREGQAVLAKHFSNGSGAPMRIIVAQNKQAEVIEALDTNDAIDGVMIVTSNKQGLAPVGKNYQFSNVEEKVIGGRVLLEATLKDAPDSKAAQEVVKQTRETVHAIDSDSIVGGITAIQFDTNEASIRDRKVIIPAVLIAITVILMILLRSVVAPLMLLGTTVLSFGAALGVSALVFNYALDLPGADPAVILYAFVFLVALGIDYNIFLMTRVREESIKLGTKKGVIKGLVVTGSVITSAGLVLAATFSALVVIPILFLLQIAFIVAFGVLLDTIVVRSLLVPALIRDIGPKVWWPARYK